MSHYAPPILAFDINGFNLIRRSGHHLFGRQDFCLDQVADDVVCHAKFCGRLRHRQPFAALFGRKVCVNIVDTADRRDAVSRPGVAKACAYAHAIESGCDIAVAPSSSHGTHDLKSVFGRIATMFAGLGLSDAQLRVLTTLPMDCQDDVARFFVDISDDVLDQRTREALPRPRADARRIPCGLQIFRQAI